MGNSILCTTTQGQVFRHTLIIELTMKIFVSKKTYIAETVILHSIINTIN